MNITIKRKSISSKGVFGEMYDDKGRLIFVTLEHAYPDNHDWWTAKVQPGVYRCVRYQSPRFNEWVFQLRDVPDFNGCPVTSIEMHPGNYSKDSEGCILIGSKLGDGCILESGAAFKAFMEIQKDVISFDLTILQ